MNPKPAYPSLHSGGPKNLAARHRVGNAWKTGFSLSIVIGLLALMVLLASIVNQAAGLVVSRNKVDPASLSALPLNSLSVKELTALLKSNLSANRIKTIERDGVLMARSQADLLALINDQIVKPEILSSHSLWDSLLHAQQIRQEAGAATPGAQVRWKLWLTPQFLTNSMSSTAERAGVRTALLGSLAMILITILVAFPTGVGAAIYLEEYADPRLRINRLIQINIDNLAGVPSIVYGILGLAIFVRALQPFTSGAIFGSASDNGRTILAAALTMALLILPVIIINAQEAIRAVPSSLRQAAYGLGATRWQTIWHHVLPYALPGIMTGTILAVSRAIGETAPLIVVGAATFITQDPTGPFSRFTALPIQIYNWTTRPQPEFRNIAAAAILVLLLTLLTMNAAAIFLRNRFGKR
jgi:phosphate transport system permease protein